MPQCTIDLRGMCVNKGAYDQYAKRAGTLNDPDFLGYFPSKNFTYCPSSDEICRVCKDRWRQTFAETGQVPKGETCRGADGCLCVAVCESPGRAESILNRICQSPFGPIGPRSKAMVTMYLCLGAVAVVLIVVVLLKAWVNSRVVRARERARRERHERRLNRPLRTGPVLALKGWSELREKLLESEREFVEGGGKLAEPGINRSDDSECGESGDNSDESSGRASESGVARDAS
ncbi:hypothetical protein PybrP1_007570 [[Pythium] brassicae (nom. inval.)]|nr:hypothetical protein PybrP1_007570 [[Pythium] brassicae (nom. inval.)]